MSAAGGAGGARRAPRASRAAERGFTLVETVIALTLMAMMMAGLFASLRFGARAWEAGDSRIAQIQARAAGSILLRGLISGTVPRLVLPGGEPVAGLEGTAARLTVLAPWPNPHGPAGLQLFELTKARDQKGLLLEWWLAREARPTGDETRRHLLMPGAEAVRFRYFGAWGDAAEPVWRSDWPRGRRLPLLVEIAIDGGAGAAAPLVVALAGADGG